jgi:hypothetical protein
VQALDERPVSVDAAPRDQPDRPAPLFYTPHIDWPIVCLPTCCGPDNPPKYPPITYGEYRVWWLNTNYGAKLDPEQAKRTAAE